MNDSTPSSAGSSTGGVFGGRTVVRAYGPSNYPADARQFLDAQYSRVDDMWTLIYHRGIFHRWTGGDWQSLELAMLKSELYRFFDGSVLPTDDDKTKYYKMTRSALAELLDALQNEVVVPETQNFNTWVRMPDLRVVPSPVDIVPCPNGLLNTKTLELLPCTPRFLNPYCLTFAYDADVTETPALNAFLDSIFGEDIARRNLLQEIIGYLCTPDQEKQKIFAFVGPPRCGKGTIARLMEKLVGRRNYGAVSLSGLGESHGLENIATKSVVVLGDAASTGRSPSRALENLLGIVGQDEVEVNPKGRAVYSATLPCRFLMLTNNMPNLFDRAGALQARMLVLRFYESYLGREDETLGDRLAAELPGVLNWALAGLARLRARGHFVQPEMGKEDLELISEISAPERIFVRDLCVLDPEVRDSYEDMYAAWRNWCHESGIRNPGTKTDMLLALKVVDPEISRGKMLLKDSAGKRPIALMRIALTEEARMKYVRSDTEFKLGMKLPRWDGTGETAL